MKQQNQRVPSSCPWVPEPADPFCFSPASLQRMELLPCSCHSAPAPASSGPSRHNTNPQILLFHSRLSNPGLLKKTSTNSQLPESHPDSFHSTQEMSQKHGFVLTANTASPSPKAPQCGGKEQPGVLIKYCQSALLGLTAIVRNTCIVQGLKAYRGRKNTLTP